MENTTAYDRGRLDGEFSARLDGHDKHFARLNGSLDRFSGELAALTSAVQSLSDGAVARDKTVLLTAAALKDASAKAWSPWSRAITVLSALVAVGSLFFRIRGF